jgi:hypothetical protein
VGPLGAKGAPPCPDRHPEILAGRALCGIETVRQQAVVRGAAAGGTNRANVRDGGLQRGACARPEARPNRRRRRQGGRRTRRSSRRRARDAGRRRQRSRGRQAPRRVPSEMTLGRPVPGARMPRSSDQGVSLTRTARTEDSGTLMLPRRAPIFSRALSNTTRWFPSTVSVAMMSLSSREVQRERLKSPRQIRLSHRRKQYPPKGSQARASCPRIYESLLPPRYLDCLRLVRKFARTQMEGSTPAIGLIGPSGPPGGTRQLKNRFCRRAEGRLLCPHSRACFQRRRIPANCPAGADK